jgi:hypothetical protein
MLVKKYIYELSYNKGSTWATICSTVAVWKNYSYNLDAFDTAYCKKSQAFTPTVASDSCQIKVTVFDLDSNSTTIFSNIFKVVGPTIILKNKVDFRINLKNRKQVCLGNFSKQKNSFNLSGQKTQCSKGIKICGF